MGIAHNENETRSVNLSIATPVMSAVTNPPNGADMRMSGKRP